MSKLGSTRSVRSNYPARLLLIDYGLHERTIQGICYGLEQLFSIVTSYVGLQHVPMFGMIVNGQTQSEIFLPLSSPCVNHMELQIALYKLQLLAQQWSIKSTSSLSWHSALQLALIEINNKKNHASNDDEHSDRLNHRYTVGFLLLCALIVTGSPFVFNRITCWVPAQFTGAYLSYTNDYCWISNTYYIPRNDTIPHSQFDRKQSEISYYQWTPFILLFFAFGFYFPRMLWRSMNTRSGIDLQYLIGRDNIEEIVHSIEHYCQANEHRTQQKNRFFRTLLCTSGKHSGNYLRSLDLIMKSLYLINSFLQLILIHIILGQPGWFYGFDIWYKVFIENSVLTDSPYFPRVTLCDLRIREVGNLHRYTVQCVLPINMLNEKVFSLLWFSFVLVFISNLCSLISTLYKTLNAHHRINFMRDFYRLSTSKAIIDDVLFEKFVNQFLQQDGTLIISLIHHNGDAFRASKVLETLFEHYELTEREYQLKKTKEKLDSSEIVDVEIIIITNRLSQSDIHQLTENHQIEQKNIELVCINDDDHIESLKQNISSSDLVRMRYLPDNKYSISLYFKSWFLTHDDENEHLQLYLPTNDKVELIDQSWHLIRCDLRKILIDPHHHINHERFFISPEPSAIIQNPSLSLPIYQLKGLNFIKQTNYCLSMIFGMPLFLIGTICQKYDSESMKKNTIAFDTLVEYLRQNELMLVCRLNEDQFFSGHFILSVASKKSLIIRSIASSELLLPSPFILAQEKLNHEQKQLATDLLHSLSKMNTETEEYNPLYYESRQSKITFNTSLL